MKRLLFIAFIAIQIFAHGQYQIRNGNFESWDNVGTTNEEPTHWSSHMTNTGTYGSLAQAQQINRSTDTYSGTGYSCQIWARSVLLSIIANGTATTGRINVGSMTASNPVNHTFTSRNESDFNEPFTGKPDSLRFWAKFICQNANQFAKLHAVIHGNYDYTDPETGNSANYVAGKAVAEFQKGNQVWTQYTVPFDYATYSNLNQTPAYILVTVTTNKNAGEGSNTDTLLFDNIEMIYNARLSNLQVGGITIPDFNPDLTDYYITTPYCGGEPLPLVTATTASTLAGTPAITQATSGNPTATITVTNGNVTKTYYVHFTVVNVSTPTVTDESRCGSGNITLTATPDTSTNICRWYNALTGGNLLYTGNSYTASVSQTTAFYVTSYNNSTGCESQRIPVIATIYPNYHPDTIHFMICGNGYYNFYGRQLVQTGIYDTIIPTIHGCDSLVTLSLTVGNEYQNNIIARICEGSTYNLNGFTENTTGIYTQNLTASNGCDSIVTLDLTVNPVYLHTTYDTICSNQIYQWRGNQYNLTGIYYDSLYTVNGCDSIYLLGLTVLNTIYTQFGTTACDSFSWDDSTYYTSGYYIHTYPASNGCDSIVTYNLLINPSYFSEILDSAHTGDIYNHYGFNIVITEEGILRDTLFLTSQTGCDSTVTLTLTVTTGIEENEWRELISLYPNPANNNITITFPEDIFKKEFMLTDITGRVVIKPLQIQNQEIKIDLKEISGGIYFVIINTEKGRITKKLIVQ